ncbi:hypothetical protein MTO96_033507 [Rhipicephalus appendiculatus]
MDTRSTSRVASTTDDDGPGAEDEAAAGAAANTCGQLPSFSESALSSRDPAMAFSEAFMAWLEDIVAFTRAALERTQPTALPNMAFGVPTFTGLAAGKSVIDFFDDQSICKTPHSLSELDVLEPFCPLH